MGQSGQDKSGSQPGDAQRGAEVHRAPRTPRKPSLRDSLAATHRHTVPLLPALDPNDVDDLDGYPTNAARSSSRHPSAGDAKSSGVKRSPRAKKTLIPDGPDTAHILLSRDEGLDAGGQPPRATASSLPGLAQLPDAPADLAGELTALVAAHTPTAQDRLPAVQAERSGAVARVGAPESQSLLIRGARKSPRPTAGRIVPRRHGPRSFISQFLIAMVMAMSLFGTVALATPLGQPSVFGNLLTTYAQSVALLPTPTATPRPTATPLPLVSGYNPPHQADPGQQVVINTINTVFGKYAGGALNIAKCESGYDPNARNAFPVGDSHAMGVFQILFPSTWAGTSYKAYSPYDYQKNIHAAYEIFSRDGYSWREWECKPA
jgi:hypothetical protein